MDGIEDRYRDIDQNVAANLRAFREARGISQEDLAQQMTDCGFGFSQATIWKIERGQRPVRAGELVALADLLGVLLLSRLTQTPDVTRHTLHLETAARRAGAAHNTLKAAAAAYLRAQIDLVVMAHEAHNAGLTVSELYTYWLTVPPEQAVVEARVEADHHEPHRDMIASEVEKISAALRGSGYEPTLRIEDVTTHKGGTLPAWSPLPADGEADAQEDAPASS